MSDSKAPPLQNRRPCRAALDGSRFPDSRKNQLELQAARAIPNRTLHRAFGIENAFKIGDEDEARLLVRNVKTLIMESDIGDGWNLLLSELYHVVVAVMEEADADAYACGEEETGPAADPGDGKRIRLLLAPMARALTLRVLLWVLFRKRSGSEIHVQLLIALGDSLHETRMGLTTADEGGEEILDFKDNHDLQF
ncbi:hypothetical protein BDW71DRAFT_212582 [Aspergillus fruticulosus]